MNGGIFTKIVSENIGQTSSIIFQHSRKPNISSLRFAQILSYVEDGIGDQPLLILGEPGAGKSAVMANAACKMADKIKSGSVRLFA